MIRPFSTKTRIWLLGLLILVGGAIWLLWQRPQVEEGVSSYGFAEIAALNPPSPDPAQPHSVDCRLCHEAIYAQWEASHHGLANRWMDVREETAFAHEGIPGEAEPVGAGQGFLLKLQTLEGFEDFDPQMVIGHDPLRQYLLAWLDGGWQTTQAAWDPHAREWFDIYGDGRGDGDWGAWSGRGMNWNSMCAYCHMTDFEKNYAPETDRYASAWHEQGVGCIQCHAPTLKNPPPDRVAYCGTLTRTQQYDNCAACHSRRADFDGAFRPGDRYEDHFHLQLPTREGLYYPDGQIRDEVYVWTSMMLSSMGHGGVRCLDCHDPHSNALILPVQDNMLCQRCHETGSLNAPVIVPEAHSFHAAGSTGNRCVECHMPHTPYMGRDYRRDHGFHNPDPRLTMEKAIPNACARCHEGQDPGAPVYTTAELMGQAEAWWGPEMNAQGRARAQLLDAAYQRRPEARAGLLEALADAVNPYWKATYLELLQGWSEDTAVRTAATPFLTSEHPQVRTAAVALLARSDPAVAEAALGDPVRSVRYFAAVMQPDRLRDFPQAEAEFNETLRYQADQPIGALNMARERQRLGKMTEAEMWFRRAMQYDGYSAAFPHEFAFFLSAQGRLAEAAVQLEAATRLDAQNALMPFHLALARAELQQPTAAMQALEESLKRDPDFARARYNLGLLQAEAGNLAAAVITLQLAERSEPANPEFPYARATLHLRLGEREAARAAAQKALQIAPDYPPALQLLPRL